MNITDPERVTEIIIKNPHFTDDSVVQKACCQSWNTKKLPSAVYEFIEEKAKLCQPDKIHICDGSAEENEALIKILIEQGAVKKLENNW